MPTRDFPGRQQLNDPDPVAFTVAGREFRCRPSPTPDAVVALTDAFTRLGANPDPLAAGVAALVFVESCVDDGEAWMGLLASGVVDAETAVDVATWLAVEYANRSRTQAVAAPHTATQAVSRPVTGDGPLVVEADDLMFAEDAEAFTDADAVVPFDQVGEVARRMAAIQAAGGTIG